MHLDFTLHFWTLLSQVLAVGSLIAFLRRATKAIRSVVAAANLILAQHHEIYGWYANTVKGKPWPAGD